MYPNPKIQIENVQGGIGSKLPALYEACIRWYEDDGDVCAIWRYQDPSITRLAARVKRKLNEPAKG